MSPEEIAEDLVKERNACLRREREIREEMVSLLVDQKMTDFFTVNWRKLERVFVHNRRR